MRPPHEPRPKGLFHRFRRARTRAGLMAQNAGELLRLGHLGESYGAPFDVMHQDAVYRLRRYARDGAHVDDSALLFVPPLMVASEIYDMSPELSAVSYLVERGVDVWLVDYGKPESEPGGMQRTLDDHVRAVVDAVRRVGAATGHAVHLAGYSQGGMFCYQAAAFLRSEGLASLITFGSPVDIHRNIPGVVDGVAAGILDVTRQALAGPLSRVEGLPGLLTSTGFKLLSVKKEAAQLVDFLSKLHDREALEQREASRRFLGGEGFVAWPGPAFRQFVDEFVVANRMTSGGFVIDGRTVTLADIRCPILYFLGERDDFARPASVRAIRRAAPHAALFEVRVKAGHFGLVVGSRSRDVTWPTVVQWLAHRDHGAALPARLDRTEHTKADGKEADFDDIELPLDLFYDVLGDAARSLVRRARGRMGAAGDSLAALRWQLPRLARLASIESDTRASLGLELTQRASEHGEGTFFIHRGRAFSYAQADARVSAIVRGLYEAGVRPGQRVAVVMRGRPSYLSAVAALSRLGAVPMLFDVEKLPLADVLSRADLAIADPEHAAATRLATDRKVLVLGGAGSERTLPAGVLDLEQIDAATVELPEDLVLDAGRAGELAMIFVRGRANSGLREAQVSHGRLMLSALGVAGAAALRSTDTVYSVLPLHHPAGMLVAVGGALVGGSRLALASGLSVEEFWPDVRRAGATVVFYANDMCRALVMAKAAVGEGDNPVRLFAGSGMRRDVWRRLEERFHVGVIEFYATTEGSAVLANASGNKLGSVGSPLPGGAELRLIAFDDETLEPVRDVDGRAQQVAPGLLGLLVSRVDPATRATPTKDDTLLRDLFEVGDTYATTGDLLTLDAEGDYTFVGRADDRVHTTLGYVSPRPVEDSLLELDAVREAYVFAVPEGARSALEVALVLRGAEEDLEALSARVAELPTLERPTRVHAIARIPLTSGFRADADATRQLLTRKHPTFAWDELSSRYRPQT